MEKKIITDAIEYITDLFSNNAGGHDTEHSLRVWRSAMRIAEQIPSCDHDRVALAALLHDADDHKLFATEDNANARAFLRSHNVTEEETDRICRIINSVY